VKGEECWEKTTVKFEGLKGKALVGVERLLEKEATGDMIDFD